MCSEPGLSCFVCGVTFGSERESVSTLHLVLLSASGVQQDVPPARRAPGCPLGSPALPPTCSWAPCPGTRLYHSHIIQPREQHVRAPGSVPHSVVWAPSCTPTSEACAHTRVCLHMLSPSQKGAFYKMCGFCGKFSIWILKVYKFIAVKLLGRDFPGGAVVKTSPSNAGDKVRSLVGKLRSHMTPGQRTKT